MERLLFHSFWGNCLFKLSKLFFHQLVLSFGHSRRYLLTASHYSFHKNAFTFCNPFLFSFFSPRPPLDKR